MPPRSGEGQPKAKPKAVDVRKTETPIDLGIGRAAASIQKAAKQISKPPVPRQRPLPISAMPGLAAATTPLPTKAQIRNKQKSDKAVQSAINRGGLTDRQRGKALADGGFRYASQLEQQLWAAQATQRAALNTVQAQPLTAAQRASLLPTNPKAKGLSGASLAALALGQTRADQAKIISQQSEDPGNFFKYDVLGINQIPHNIVQNSKSVAGFAQNYGMPSNGPTPVYDPNHLPVNAGIIFPGGGGRMIGKLGEMLSRGGKVAEDAAVPAEAVPSTVEKLRDVRSQILKTQSEIDAQNFTLQKIKELGQRYDSLIRSANSRGDHVEANKLQEKWHEEAQYIVAEDAVNKAIDSAHGTTAQVDQLNAGLGDPHSRMADLRLQEEQLRKELAQSGNPDNPIADAIPGMRKAAAEQAKNITSQKAERIQAAKIATAEAEGLDKAAAFKQAMSGEYNKVDFKQLTNLDDQTLHGMVNQINDHPGLDFMEGQRGIIALGKLVAGKSIQPNEIDTLEKVFGKEAVQGLQDSSALLSHAARLGAEIINVPRSIMASIDLSAPFRQGLVLGARHPIIFFKNFKPMIQALKSEPEARAMMESIAADPEVKRAINSGLDLTDFEHLLPAGKSEEQFMYSNLAETLTGDNKFVRKLTGDRNISPIAASGRAYTTFLNKFRFDVWKHYVDQLEKSDPAMLKDARSMRQIANFINSATGRGRPWNWTGLEQGAAGMNAIFFSPRLLYSRLNFLSPTSDLSLISPRFWVKQNPFVRRQVAIAMGSLAGTASLTLYLLHLAGAKVGLNPLSADFGKAKFGNTRIDILGGFQQPIRLAAQEFKGKQISSVTGKEMTLSGDIGKSSRWDIGERFLLGKFAPVPGVARDFLRGKNFQGQPFNLKNELEQMSVPLIGQDVADVQNNYHNPWLAAATYGVGAFGVGFQTYGPKDVLGAQHKKNEEKTQAWLHGANALLGQAAKAGGQTYHGLPAVIVRAAGVKLKYEDALAQLKAKNPSIWAPHSSKMSDAEKERRSEVQNRQTAAVLAHLLIDSHPGFTGGDQLLQTIHDAPPSELSGIASRIKQGLGLDVIDRLDRGINEQRHRQADQHFIQTHH